LGYAQYEGTALDIGVNQFLGIRYAAPPLGNLRFRAPEDPVITHGVQDAKEVFTLPYFCGFNDLKFSHFSSLEQPASVHLGPDQYLAIPLMRTVYLSMSLHQPTRSHIRSCQFGFSFKVVVMPQILTGTSMGLKSSPNPISA
jgi:hypothetical protein